jgi:argininosuccinate synthase
MSTNNSPIILAFSGGLDTSFCVPWLMETYDRPVVTATIDTGGLDAAARTALAERSQALGAVEHVLIDARDTFFDEVLKYLVFGNVRRGQLYPLCVGAERGVQAPVRDHAWQRKDQVAFLEARGVPVPKSGSAYSINRGLWGVTIGGTETLTSTDSIPDSAWVLSTTAFADPRPPETVTISYEHGVPTAVNGESAAPVALIEQLEAIGSRFGIGRGIHLGDTIIGTKGRVAFEAPAAELLIVAHRELEKLTLTGLQQRIKEPLGLTYGDLVHEGRQLDPVCRDIEALLASSQRRVTGTVRCTLRPGSLFVQGAESPHSLLAASRGKYGEAAGEWTPADALGFSKILSLPGMLYTRAKGD